MFGPIYYNGAWGLRLTEDNGKIIKEFVKNLRLIHGLGYSPLKNEIQRFLLREKKKTQVSLIIDIRLLM